MKTSLALVAFLATGLSSAAAIPSPANTSMTTPALETRTWQQRNHTSTTGWKLHEDKFQMVTIRNNSMGKSTVEVMPVKGAGRFSFSKFWRD